MYTKIVTDLLLSSTSEPAYSQPIALGGQNGAMFEVWLKSQSNLSTDGVTVSLQGSNDNLNWSAVYTTGTTTATTGTTAPKYTTSTRTDVVPFSHIRLKFTMTGTSPTALVDAAVRTYTTSA